MRRREFFAAIGGAVAAWPLATHAQEPGRIYRLSLMTASLKRDTPPIAAFFDELRVSGFVEGQNLKVDGGGYGPRDEQLPEIVAAIAKSPPDVIFVPQFPKCLLRRRQSPLFPSSASPMT